MTVADPDSPLLDAPDPDQVTEALHGLAERAAHHRRHRAAQRAGRLGIRDPRLRARLPAADRLRARRSAPHPAWPGPVFNGSQTGAVVAVVEHASAAAPFTPWAARFELADAVGLDLTDRVRRLLGTAPLLMPEIESGFAQVAIDEIAVRRFFRRVRHYLNHPDDEEPLGRLMDAFALSKTELAGLFGVSRQAIDGWLQSGVPSERQEKLITLLDIADLLDRKLKAGRLSGVARRAADAYGGQTMLELIAADRHRELLDSVRASFDWSQAA